HERVFKRSNFLMVEEGFTTRDLLENLLGELCQEVRAAALEALFPVKCNGSEGVIRLLAELGAGFACANKGRISAVLNSALDLYSRGQRVDIIARPGDSYVTSAFTLAVSITALEEIPVEQPGSDEERCGSKKSLVYHLSDGIYGCLQVNLSPRTWPQRQKSYFFNITKILFF
uniref:Orn/DAP/Arg decarboxylase 2 N-terminal domain-containing protein n=1 Tax=Malurus cyaneus samueli TaxID=2593467 RepID=A0A8C5TSY7_9PASS